MEFNIATLYKVPFDNTYKHVVDYNRYITSAGRLNKQLLVASDIRELRNDYFDSLPSRSIYQGGYKLGRKSVKINGKYIECSIALNIDVARDYNYIVFELSERPDDRGNLLYCFINSTTSNNNSSYPSTTIYAEIDYWTQYIDTLYFNTPLQYTEFAHTNPKKFNAKADSRVPTEFIRINQYDYGFKDCIIFMYVDIAPSHSHTPEIPSGTYYPICSSTGKWFRYYLPIFAVKTTGGITSILPIQGIYYAGDNPPDTDFFYDYGDTIFKNGWLSLLDSQYIFNAGLTFMLPTGIVKSSLHTVVRNEKQYIKLDNLTLIGANGYYSIEEQSGLKLYGNFGYNNNFLFPAFYISNTANILSYYNDEKYLTLTSSFSYDRNIYSGLSPLQEIKLLQYPYNITTLIYKGKEYNITPEADGSTTTPSIRVYFRLFDGMEMRIVNTTGVSDTLYISMGESDYLPTSVDEYTRYKQTQLTGDAIKASTTTLTAILSAIAIAGIAASTGGAGAPLAIGGAVAGAVGTTATTWASFGATQAQKSKLPETVNNPSQNAIDLLPSIVPMIKTCILKSEDRELLTSIWTHYGYPVFTFMEFVNERFWYDYKKLKETTLPNITNPIARQTLENCLNNGVTIWHSNTIDGTLKSTDVGDYDKNNPSCWDCKEGA